MALTVERAWAGHAAKGGMVAGVSFAAFEMCASGVLRGIEHTFMPLRMIAGIGVGPLALDSTFPLFSAISIAVILHLILSVSFALLFVAVVQPTSTLRSTSTLLLSTSLYGLVLWLVNFYVIAPVMGWGWFAGETNPLVQFLAHTFFYGWMLGAYLGRHAVLVFEQADYDATAHHKRT